jgi:hypothetical protein
MGTLAGEGMEVKDSIRVALAADSATDVGEVTALWLGVRQSHLVGSAFGLLSGSRWPSCRVVEHFLQEAADVPGFDLDAAGHGISREGLLRSDRESEQDEDAGHFRVAKREAKDNARDAKANRKPRTQGDPPATGPGDIADDDRATEAIGPGRASERRQWVPGRAHDRRQPDAPDDDRIPVRSTNDEPVLTTGGVERDPRSLWRLWAADLDHAGSRSNYFGAR